MGNNTWTKVKKRILKIWLKTIFNSGRNLKNLICRNKSKLLRNSVPGVYQLDCTCNALYIRETKKEVVTRTKNTDRTVSMESGKAQTHLSIT